MKQLFIGARRALRTRLSLATMIGAGMVVASASLASSAPYSVAPPGPDTYAGSFQLSADGVLWGPLASLDGCQANLFRTETIDPNTGKPITRIQQQGFQACELTFGFSLRQFLNWFGQTVTSGNKLVTHTIRIEQFDCNAGCARKKAITIDRAMITGFSVPPLDGRRQTFVTFAAEIQSQDQTVTSDNATGAFQNAALMPIDSSTIQSSVSSVGLPTSKPIVTTTAPYTWSLPVTRTCNSLGCILRAGRATWSDLSALVASGKALDDLRIWQNEQTMHPRTGDWSFATGVTGPRMAFTFSGLMLVAPVDPFERLQSNMFRWGEHADDFTIAIH